VDQVLEHIDNPPVRVVDEDKFVAHITMDETQLRKLTLTKEWMVFAIYSLNNLFYLHFLDVQQSVELNLL
jgi:hypothetical protein